MPIGDNNRADVVAELLLRYRRDPSRYEVEVLFGDRSAANSETIVKLALGRAVAFQDPARESSAARKELQQAAIHYVREVFFRAGATPFENLGLAPGATQDEIRSAYRLLMQLVHPDRQESGEKWPESFAAQANKAYGELSDARTRLDLERELNAVKQHGVPGVDPAGPASPNPLARTARRPPVKATVPEPVLPEFLTWRIGGVLRAYPKTALVLGSALVAAIVVRLMVGADDGQLAREQPGDRSRLAAVDTKAAEDAKKAEARKAEDAKKAAEAKAAEEAKKAAEAKAAEEAKQAAIAQAKAAEEAKKAAEAKAAEEAKQAAIAQARAVEEAKKAAAAAQARAVEDAKKVAAAAQAKAIEDAKKVAAAQAKAVEDARKVVEAEKKAAEDAKRVAVEAKKAAEDARKMAEAEKKAAEAEKRAAEVAKKALEAEKKAAVAQKAPPPVVATAAPAPAPVAAPPPPQAAPAPAPAPAPPPPAPAGPPPLTETEIEGLLASFAQTYEAGRIDAFTALFADDATVGGKRGAAAIRAEYDDLFRTTTTRKMRLTRANWTRNGDRATARGEIAVKIIWRDGREADQRLLLNMDIQRKDGRAVIGRLMHQPID